MNPQDANSNLSQDNQSLDELIETLHDAQKPRTLEEQVAYLKSKGIDPTKTYREWDDESKDQ